MRTLTACFLSLGIGLFTQPAGAAPNGAEAGLAVRGAIPSAFTPEQPAPSARKRGVPLDLDGDGVVSEEEAQAYYTWIFALLDRDGDGVVSKLEFIQALSPRGKLTPLERNAKVQRLGVLFARLDRDENELLDEAEFMGACDVHYATADADGDGIISVEEFASRRPM